MTHKPDAVVERVARAIERFGLQIKDVNEIARSAIAAHLDALKAEGWTLVPREPTEAMIEAGGDAVFDVYDGYNTETKQRLRVSGRATNEGQARRAYRSMIAAAEEKA